MCQHGDIVAHFLTVLSADACLTSASRGQFLIAVRTPAFSMVVLQRPLAAMLARTL